MIPWWCLWLSLVLLVCMPPTLLSRPWLVKYYSNSLSQGQQNINSFFTLLSLVATHLGLYSCKVIESIVKNNFLRLRARPACLTWVNCRGTASLEVILMPFTIGCLELTALPALPQLVQFLSQQLTVLPQVLVQGYISIPSLIYTLNGLFRHCSSQPVHVHACSSLAGTLCTSHSFC